MHNTDRSRLKFLTQLTSFLIAIAAVVACGGNAVNAPTRAERTHQILTNFSGIKNDYERLRAEIAGQIHVRFNLAPELSLPGETIQLSLEAHCTNPPNPTLELLEDCFREIPAPRNFALTWKRERKGNRYTTKWRWRPSHCGNYQVRWRCDIGGDIPEFRRNFSVIDRSYLTLILNSTSHREPRPEPDFHELGLPFSYWAEQTLFGKRQTAAQFTQVSRWARQFGDDPGLLIFMGGDYLPGDKTVFYDEPEEVQRLLLKCYREFWPMLGFQRPLECFYTYGMGNGPMRSARAEGYDLLGALCADQNWGDGPFKINHWGMPARPYFVSREDFRKPGNGGGRAMVGVQQCERLTVPCRDYNCVYAFEGAIGYALDQYSGITRRRVVDDALISREMDFLQCCLECAGQTDAPMLVSCGIEFNGVWPDMAAINRHFLEYLVRRARNTKLAFSTATAAAAFLRRHYRRTPETVLYLPDVYAGVTSNGKLANYPDTMEIENDRFKAIFRRGETLPYAQYDYTSRWQYPDWGNEDIPRDKQGYVIPSTDDRFRVTPPITDTRPFKVSWQMEEIQGATRVCVEVDAAASRSALALAVWDIPREYSQQPERFRLLGAQRFIPVRAPFTGNLNGILVADIKKGLNRITLTVATPARTPRFLDLRLSDGVMAKVFERDGGAMAYVFPTRTTPQPIELKPPEGVTVRLYPADSDTPTLLSEPTVIEVETGQCLRIGGLTSDQLLDACPSAKSAGAWDVTQTFAK